MINPSEIKRKLAVTALAASTLACTISYETAGTLGVVTLALIVGGGLAFNRWYNKQPKVIAYKVEKMEQKAQKAKERTEILEYQETRRRTAEEAKESELRSDGRRIGDLMIEMNDPQATVARKHQIKKEISRIARG